MLIFFSARSRVLVMDKSGKENGKMMFYATIRTAEQGAERSVERRNSVAVAYWWDKGSEKFCECDT